MSATSSVGSTTNGRITKDTRTIDGAPYATSYSYDSLDRTTWMQYPDGEGVTLAYSPQGQVKSLGSYLSSATFKRAGRPPAIAMDRCGRRA
ncbi:MAG: hypothetical protein M9927_00655 [Anaerolineae bacterium]|nr:hypothetical protein [Anaerolineae bacterium]